MGGREGTDVAAGWDGYQSQRWAADGGGDDPEPSAQRWLGGSGGDGAEEWRVGETWSGGVHDAGGAGAGLAAEPLNHDSKEIGMTSIYLIVSIN
eukprot:COSAG01_NODE_2591_length_7409_cov_109.624077_6_plen_94_part_00